MTTRDKPWPTGTPCWVDLLVDDIPAAQTFYGDLFGWEFDEASAGSGGYVMGEIDGHPVAGIGPRPEALDVPSVWTTYLATDDADDTAQRITEQGGSLLLQPFDVFDIGRMGVAFDPGGAAFGIWEAKSHLGAGIVNVAGALTWNECMTRHYDSSLEFYRKVFGFDYDDAAGGENIRYSLVTVGGAAVAGLGELTDDVPEEIPGHWMTFFAADDTDAALDRAADLGAVVRVPASDTPYGRMAVLEGPQGEVFSVITVVDVEGLPNGD